MANEKRVEVFFLKPVKGYAYFENQKGLMAASDVDKYAASGHIKKIATTTKKRKTAKK